MKSVLIELLEGGRRRVLVDGIEYPAGIKLKQCLEHSWGCVIPETEKQ